MIASETLQRDRSVRRVILIEGAANLGMAAAKVAIGLMTGSLAILADAFHSVSDAANNGMAWMVVNWSSRPADAKHPYGHRKFETVAVFVLATVLTVTAFELALSALRRGPPSVSQSMYGAVGMGLLLLGNIALAVWERRWARKLRSDILEADAHHTLADVLTTVVAIVGWQASAAGFAWVDTLSALGVAALILFLAFGLFRRSLPILVDQVSIDPEHIRERARRLPGVLEVREVRSRSDGVHTAVELTVVVSAGLSTVESHRVADRVEELVRAEFASETVTVHIEPSPSV